MRITKYKKYYIYKNKLGEPHDPHAWPAVLPGYRYLRIGEVFNKFYDLFSYTYVAADHPTSPIYSGHSEWTTVAPEHTAGYFDMCPIGIVDGPCGAISIQYVRCITKRPFCNKAS